MFSKIFLFLSVLASEVNGMTSRPLKFRQKSTVEPLLRFPFARSLANPCGFRLEPARPSLDTAEPQQLDHFDTSDQHRLTLAPLRDVSEDIPLDQQVLDFLSPFMDLISAVNKPRLLNDTKMKEQSTQELKLVVSQALLLIRRIYSPSALRKCRGFQLESLSRDNLFALSSTGGVQLDELYHSLMIISAHLHVMIRDVHDSTRFCPSENFAKLQILRQLAGKLEMSMCLILHSAIVIEENENLNYLTVIRKVLQSHVHRYYACSAREIQGCLVLRNACKILNLIQKHFQRTRKVSFTKMER